MRHASILKALFCLPFLLAACAWADQTADRAAIGRAIAAANQFPPRAELFAADAEASSVLDQLWSGKHLAFGIRPGGGDAAASSSSDRPTVMISHEPWGEATINFPGRWPHATMEVVNPRIVSRTTRFITPDVALAEGACVYQEDGGGTHFTPLLFVMKREGGEWKIASLRVLAPR